MSTPTMSRFSTPAPDVSIGTDAYTYTVEIRIAMLIDSDAGSVYRCADIYFERSAAAAALLIPGWDSRCIPDADIPVTAFLMGAQ